MLSSIFFKFQYVTKSDFKYIQVCSIFVNTIFQHIPVYQGKGDSRIKNIIEQKTP